MKRVVVTLLALFAAVSVSAQTRWATKPPAGVIIEFRDAPAALAKTSINYRATITRFRADLASISRKADVRREYSRVLNGVSARVPRADLAAIARLPYVKSIHDDHVMRKMALQGVAFAQVGADKFWAQYATRGKGVIVAVIDTGVDYTHEALGQGFGPGFKVAGGWDFVNDDADPMDDVGHGTHVAGIIAGESSAINGVAPEATLLAYKVLDENGFGSESDVIAAIERAADPNDDGDTSDHVDVANLSLGGDGGPDDAVSRAVDNGTKLGITFCIAAGNSGQDHSVASPGTARQAITVGAVDGSDNLANFSSRGPAPLDMTMKPEVAAPGVNITSAIPGNIYFVASGTSMATPHVSGAAALLKALHRDWTPLQIKTALILTGQRNNQGAMSVGGGRIDVLAAASNTLAFDAPSIDFGLDDVKQASWTATRTIHVTNRSDKSADWTLSTLTNLGVATATLSPQALSLAPGQSGSITLGVSVDNSRLVPGMSGGDVITMTSPTAGTVRVPWTFVKAVRATLHWEKEFADVRWLDSTRSVFAGAAQLDSNVSEALVPRAEDYDVIVFGSTLDSKTGAMTRGTLLYLEKTHLDGDMTINATEAMGTHVIRGATIGADGKPLPLGPNQVYGIAGWVRYPKGTSFLHDLFIPPLPLHEMHINTIADGFGLLFDEQVTDFVGNNIYDIHHPMLHGVSADVTLAATNLKSAPLQILISSSSDGTAELDVRMQGTSHTSSDAPTFATYPVSDGTVWSGRVFVTPDADPLYDGGVQFSVITGQELRYNTPQIGVVNDQLLTRKQTILARRTDNGTFLFGAGPRLPLLNFCCITPSLKPAVLTQLYDSRGEEILYDPYKTTAVVFDSTGAKVASFKANPSLMDMSKPGAYSMEITNHQPVFLDLPTTTQVTLHMDSTRSDYIPPTLTGIWLLDGAGNAIRNAPPHASSSLYFTAADYKQPFNSGYAQVRTEATAVWYRYAGATAWNQLAATQVSEDPVAGVMYRVDLSSVASVSQARVELKIDIQDVAGNSTSVFLSPAFSVGSEFPTKKKVIR